MKSIILALMLTLSFSVFSKGKKKKVSRKVKTFYSLAKQQYKKKNYNLSLYYVLSHFKKHPKEIDASKIKVANILLAKTGSLPLYFYDPKFLEGLKVPTVQIHLANHYFKKKQYDKALKFAGEIKEGHNLYPESQFLMGSAKQLLGWTDYPENYKNCMDSAKSKVGSVKSQKFARYYISIQESCLANMARDLYVKKDYEKSNELYLEVDKRSYSWPYILLERAWNYYKTRDYNRTLGTLMTYQSPLLESYFFPEAEVLQALSYYSLCLYKDSATLIDKFFKVYKPRAKVLRNFLVKNKNNENLFFNLVAKPKDQINNHEYILSLRNQLKKKIRMNLHLYSYKNAQRELENIMKSGNARDIKFAKYTVKKMKSIINLHVKEYYYYFVNQINFFAYEMFNLKLEIISRRKDLLYENRKLVSKRARGSYGNLQQKESEFFYTFNGAFWADELGDYSFGLKSNCKAIKQKVIDDPLFNEAGKEVKKLKKGKKK